MKILVKRGPQRWLLYWRPVKTKQWYLVNYVNVVFFGAISQIRAKINELLQGKISQAKFEGYYCRETKTLALWS